ncbi:MAG: DUF748 domain-containing protein [Limisphaerales bacterium]
MRRNFVHHPILRRISRLSRWIVALIIFLVVVRISLPFVVKAYVNHKLNEANDYAGHIGDVDMKLWKGGYRIHQIEILKKTAGVQSPLFSAKVMDLSIEWRELFDGAIAWARSPCSKPRVNIVSGPTPEQTQNGEDERWDKMLQALFPFKVNRFQIDDGEIHFQNPSATPPVDIYLRQVSATATNLTNARDLKEKLPAGLIASGSALGGGQLSLQLQMNLLKPMPTYEMNCGLTNVDLVALNDFLRAYGKFDVAHGDFCALYLRGVRQRKL